MPRELRGPQRTGWPIGDGVHSDNPMALLGFVLSIAALLMTPLTFGTHVALGFTIPLVPAAVSYVGYWQATRQARPYRRLALVGLVLSLLIHIVIALAAALAIAVVLGFVALLIDADSGTGNRRRRSYAYRRTRSGRSRRRSRRADWWW